MGSIRRGLPRVKGGEPWPPAIEVEAPAAAVAEVPSAPDAVEPATSSHIESVQPATGGAVASAATEAAAADPAPDARTPTGVSLRRGLPRAAGGEPWPPASDTTVASAARATAAPAAVRAAAAAEAPSEPVVVDTTASPREQPVQATESGALAAQGLGGDVATSGYAVRRGLPRVAGGEPWPPAGTVPATVGDTAAPSAGPTADVAPTSAAPTPDVATTSDVATTADVAASEAIPPADVTAATAVTRTRDVSTPLSYPRTVWPGRAPRHAAAPLPEPSPLRPSWPQAIGGLLGLASLGLVAVAAVFLVRTVLSTPLMQDFLATYPGEYHPAVDVEPGFAPWANWAHFFNMFLMVLIIRSGLRVRSEKRPTVFWTPRRNPKGKISLTLWFHQALDLLWIINGVIFVVLLFTTGHWARIVPTSWAVLPNALSAGLQYVSFDWPTDNGWVNYNSLQQLAYFVTVFIAAPLAIVTGFRMSGLWPKKAEKLSRAYPVEWARALHFPVMLYFVAFIIVHVALVFLTGMLRNLNHMFAAQGSVDGAEYAANWTGFWVFLLAMAVIAAGWFAARPLVLAPIAKLFGQVSGR